MLVRAGADVNRCDVSGGSAVQAARRGDSLVLQAMLRAGADINGKDVKGFSPLLAVVLDELDRFTSVLSDVFSFEYSFLSMSLLLRFEYYI